MEILTPPEPKERTKNFEQKTKKQESEPQTGEGTFAKPPIPVKIEDQKERENKIQKVFQEIMFMFKRFSGKDMSPVGGNSWSKQEDHEVPNKISGSDHERFMKPVEEKKSGQALKYDLSPSKNEKIPEAKEDNVPPKGVLN